MTEPESHVIARRFLRVWNAGGEEIVDELASPELVISYPHFPEPLRGAQAFKDALRRTHQFFPDLAISDEHVLSCGDHTVVRWTYQATHQHGKLFGVEATGKIVHVSGITIYQIREGRVQREDGVVDNLSLLLQLRGHL